MDEKETNDSMKVNIQANNISGQVAVGNNLTQEQSKAESEKEAFIPRDETLSEASLAELVKLRQILSTLFNERELRDLCFDLNLDYENLAGTSKADKARELVTYFQRRNNLLELRSACQLRRPHAFE